MHNVFFITESGNSATNLHNAKRQLHKSTPNVASSFSLALQAKSCADTMINNPSMNPAEHPCNPSDGENIFTYQAGSSAGELLDIAVNVW